MTDSELHYFSVSPEEIHKARQARLLDLSGIALANIYFFGGRHAGGLRFPAVIEENRQGVSATFLDIDHRPTSVTHQFMHAGNGEYMPPFSLIRQFQPRQHIEGALIAPQSVADEALMALVEQHHTPIYHMLRRVRRDPTDLSGGR